MCLLLDERCYCMCPHTTAYTTVCVLILPHILLYVSSLRTPCRCRIYLSNLFFYFIFSAIGASPRLPLLSSRPLLASLLLASLPTGSAYTSVYVSAYYCMCPHPTVFVSSYYCVPSCYSMCPHTTICVLILLYVCPHTAIYMSSYVLILHIFVLILLYMCVLIL